MALTLILIPLLFAALAFALPSERWRPWLVPMGGATHLTLVVLALRRTDVTAFGGWVLLDPLGRLFLGLLSLLFFLCALYVPGYLALRRDRSNRVFCTCLLAFLGTMTLMTASHHLGLMWVALEATTLASAPLLYFNRNQRSLEATWKYLLIGSVGIALALLGSLFLAYSAFRAGLDTSLLFDDLIRDAPQLSRPWLHSAFVLLFVGYGTKMGLAPMHTWKPDAYGESPGVVGALLAGGLTNCAFLALLRFYQICAAAGEAAFVREIMVVIGLLSMAVAGVFMARHGALVLLLPPLLLGVITKTKAAFAGRVGAPLLQPYHDIIKLFRKSSVFSRTTTWVFRAGPVVGLATALLAALLIPLGDGAAPVSFEGDLVLFAYLFGLGRFFTVSAALDTGSAFEGMGGAREATFSCLTEPALFLCLLVLVRASGSLSLSGMLGTALAASWPHAAASFIAVVASLLIVILAENSRIPFDDPNTHLELTMIHEVMVLDHGGPALGMILYGAAIKLFLLGAIVVRIAIPYDGGDPWFGRAVFVGGMLLLAVVIGVVESVMARLRLLQVPSLLVTACVLSAFGVVLLAR